MVKLLIVEDEGLIAFDLKSRLERVGYTVPVIVDNMDKALDAVAAHKPELVLMDIRLKGTHDGIEAAGRIRLQFDIPVIFVTAHADAATLQRAKLAQPFGYIVKPFVNVDFRSQIETVLWKHSMERRVRVSEAWLSSTLHNIADALIATDPQGNIAFMNASAELLTGWSSADARGKPLLDVFFVYEEQSGQPVINPLQRIYDGKKIDSEPVTFFLQHRNPEQSTLVQTRFSANRDETGLVGVLVLFSDVTAQRKAEQHRSQLEKMQALSLLASGLSQDLTDSLGMAEDSLKELLTTLPDQGRETAQSAALATSHAAALALQLRELGMKEPAHAVPTDLNEALSTIAKNSTKLLGRKWPLTLHLQPELPLICVEPENCSQSLLGLFREAREAMPKGGEIVVTTKVMEAENGRPAVQLTVHDTGQRVFGKASTHAFDPYYFARSSTHNAGLSLALVYHFVSVSGGCIDCTSSLDGTAFVLSFPAVVTPGKPLVELPPTLAYRDVYR